VVVVKVSSVVAECAHALRLCCNRLKRDLDVILSNVERSADDSALVNIISLLTSSIRQLLVCSAVELD